MSGASSEAFLGSSDAFVGGVSGLAFVVAQLVAVTVVLVSLFGAAGRSGAFGPAVLLFGALELLLECPDLFGASELVLEDGDLVGDACVEGAQLG